MKRLFAYMGLTALFTLTIVFYFHLIAISVVCLCSTIFIALGLFVDKFAKSKNIIIFVCLTAIVSSICSGCYTEFYYKPLAEKYLGDTVTLRAEICEQPTCDGNAYFYELKAMQIDENKENFKIILITPEELLCEYKDIINCRVTLYECEVPHYKSMNAVYTARSDEFYLEYTVEPVAHKGAGNIVTWLREKLLHAVRTLIPGLEGDLCSAIALGDKHGIGADLIEKFEDTGLSHFIVVSGMHLSILVFIILKFLSFLPKNLWGNTVRFLIILLFVVTFMGITGFNSSIVRSGITALLTALGVIFYRKSDPLNSLGIAAMLQTINPYAVGDVGLLLSYSAVLGLLILHPMLHNFVAEKLDYPDKSEKYYKKEKHNFKEFLRFYLLKSYLFVIDLFLLSFSAVVFVTPVTIVFFGTVTPVGIIMSGVLSLPINILLICTLLCSVLWYIPLLSYLTAPFAFAAYYIAKFTIVVVEWTAKLPFSQIYVNSTNFLIWFVITGLICIVVIFVKGNKKCSYKIISYSSVAFILFNMIGAVVKYDAMGVYVYPAGKGITVAIKCNNQSYVLSCGSDAVHKSRVIDLLHKEVTDVDFLVVPSTRNSEARLAENILREFDVNSILLYYMSSTDEEVYASATQCNNYYEFYRDDVYEVDLGGNLKDVVINVDNHTYQYVYNDDMSLLIIPNYGECQEIPEEYREADFVIMCDEPDDLELLKYKKSYWCSDETVPNNLKNVTVIGEDVLKIYK